MALGMPMAMGGAVAQAAQTAAAPALNAVANTAAQSAMPGFFSSGGILEKLASMYGAQAGGLGGLGAMGGVKFAMNRGGRSFAFGNIDNGGGMAEEEKILKLAERLMSKANSINEAPISQSAPERQVRAADFTVPNVGLPYIPLIGRR